MPLRTQSITPFKQGQNSSDISKKSPKVPVLSESSKTRFSPKNDPLLQSLSTKMPKPILHKPGSEVRSFRTPGKGYNPDKGYGSMKRG